VSLPRLTLLIFMTLQIADGVITYSAVSIFGPTAEGNPILATWMHLAGIGPTLFVAKVLACGGGLFLYHRRGHAVLAGLTIGYALGAVVPWLRALASI
jgi:hypothetical protein